jgi:hypothetical protein
VATSGSLTSSLAAIAVGAAASKLTKGSARLSPVLCVARIAPVAVSDVSDLIEMAIVQSLLDRHLIVQVGERLDTYWDIFRDYLTTGTVPIKEGFILRLNPSPSMGVLLRGAIDRGGAISVVDAMTLLRTSEAVIFNTVRDLRLLGLVSYEPGTIHIAESAMADDAESALRTLAAVSLRRHRAFEIVVDLVERATGAVSIAEFSEHLATAFPAVNAKPATWDQYARAFAYWLAYARLIGLASSGITVEPADTQVDLSLLTRQRRVSVSGLFPHSPAGPALDVARQLISGRSSTVSANARTAALTALEVLGLLSRPAPHVMRLDTDIFDVTGTADPAKLRHVLEERVGGAAEALTRIEADASITPMEVGLILKDAQKTEWASGTIHSVGKYFRSWARAAGVATSHTKSSATPVPSLFDDNELP